MRLNIKMTENEIKAYRTANREARRLIRERAAAYALMIVREELSRLPYSNVKSDVGDLSEKLRPVINK